MTAVHRIHLKGPWDYEWLDGPYPAEHADKAPSEEDDSVLLPNSRVRLPSSVQQAFGAVTGTLQLSRRFHKPTNLDEDERVRLVFDGIRGTVVACINGQELGRLENPPDPVSFDITGQLQLSNLLRVELRIGESDLASPTGLTGPVALEIHAD